MNGCGYKSLYKQYVWRHHEAQHTGRKFMCEYCGNELRSKVALTLHVRIHLGVKPHVCQICGQAFRQSSILKVHSHIHNVAFYEQTIQNWVQIHQISYHGYFYFLFQLHFKSITTYFSYNYRCVMWDQVFIPEV